MFQAILSSESKAPCSNWPCKEIHPRADPRPTNKRSFSHRPWSWASFACYVLMKIYDFPKNLVLSVNASQEEESAIREELGMMGIRRPGLRVVGERRTRIGKFRAWVLLGRGESVNWNVQTGLYKKGGLMSVTSRILLVDMLHSDIPIDLTTGILVPHVEKYILILDSSVIWPTLHSEQQPSSLKHSYYDCIGGKNTAGFLKAFSDQPEHTSGMSPLKNIMKELQLRKLHISPRFREEVKGSLERRKETSLSCISRLRSRWRIFMGPSCSVWRRHWRNWRDRMQRCVSSWLSNLTYLPLPLVTAWPWRFERRECVLPPVRCHSPPAARSSLA